MTSARTWCLEGSLISGQVLIACLCCDWAALTSRKEGERSRDRLCVTGLVSEPVPGTGQLWVLEFVGDAASALAEVTFHPVSPCRCLATGRPVGTCLQRHTDPEPLCTRSLLPLDPGPHFAAAGARPDAGSGTPAGSGGPGQAPGGVRACCRGLLARRHYPAHERCRDQCGHRAAPESHRCLSWAPPPPAGAGLTPSSGDAAALLGTRFECRVSAEVSRFPSDKPDPL